MSGHKMKKWIKQRMAKRDMSSDWSRLMDEVNKGLPAALGIPEKLMFTGKDVTFNGANPVKDCIYPITDTIEEIKVKDANK